MSRVPRISVVVPTQRRPDALARAVRSVFAQQGLEQGEVEIVVVDNDLDPTARDAVAALERESAASLVYVHEPRPGVATARNAGVRAARGVLLAFLDDDQEAAPRWLAELLAVRWRLSAQAVFCPVRAALPPEVRRHRRYFEHFFTHDGPATEQRVHRGYGAGCSLVDRAALPDPDAPFATAFNLTGGEDDELFVRMLQGGSVLAWTPAVWVWEHPARDRIGLRFALRRAFTYGQGSTNTPLLHDPPQRMQAARSMVIGVGQAVLLGAASALLWLVRQPDRAFVYDKAARGLGKVLASPRFRLQFYGLAPGQRAGRPRAAAVAETPPRTEGGFPCASGLPVARGAWQVAPMLAPAPAGEARPPSPPPAGRGRASVGLALALTLAAGMVDATGFLAFGGVFVSFMSGNTTRLGVALAQGSWPTAVLFVSTIALFVAGAAVGHALAVAGGRWRRPVVLTLTAMLLLMAAAVGRLEWTSAALILAAPAMGVMNAAVAHADGVPVTPTYVTGMLVRLGDALADWALGRGGRAIAVLAPMWLAMLLGAGAGAWAFSRWALTALAAPAGLILLLAVLTALIPALRPSRSEP